MKIIAIIFLTYLLLKYLGRILVPILLKRFASKMRDNFQGQFNQQNSHVEEEGEVSIKTKPKKSKTDTNDMGEYVDFEEVDD